MSGLAWPGPPFPSKPSFQSSGSSVEPSVVSALTIVK